MFPKRPCWGKSDKKSIFESLLENPISEVWQGKPPLKSAICLESSEKYVKKLHRIESIAAWYPEGLSHRLGSRQKTARN